MKSSSDHKTLRLDINADLDAEQVDRLISELARARGTLLPAVADFGVGEDPHLNVATDATLLATPIAGSGVQVIVRHKGYGWISFPMSYAEAMLLRDQLHAFIPDHIQDGFTSH